MTDSEKGITAYDFKVPMNNAEIVHVMEAPRDPRNLVSEEIPS